MIYQGTISYVKIDGSGKDKACKDSYLIDAETFASVENTLYDEFGHLTDIDVQSIKRSRITEIANARTNEDEKIFIAILVDVFIGEDGTTKETKYQVAFFSKDINTAHAYIREYVKQGYSMEIKALKESKLVDVISA